MRTQLSAFFALLLPLAACDAGGDSNADTSEPGDSAADTGTGDSGDTAEEVWGQAALDFVEERLQGKFQGEWQLYGLDANDEPEASYSWTDEIEGKNARIEGDRAFVDIIDEMDGGRWQQTVEFIEGVYISEDGGIGDYFFEIDGAVTIATETEPDVWTYQTELADYELDLMANVDADNLVEGYKSTVKLVSWVDGWERHDVTSTTHVEYVGSDGTTVVEFTSMEGYHQRYE